MEKETDPPEARIAAALGRIPSGLYILAALHENRVYAMLASWVQQASFKPPAISIAVARDRQITEAIRASKKWALSILWDKSKYIVDHFARPIAEGKDPFAGIRVVQSPGGFPIVVDSVAWVECQVISSCDFGADHELFVGAITNGAPMRRGKPFFHLRVNGLRY